MQGQDFYTFREYMSKINKPLSASMEDYLEMIYRLSLKSGYTRMHELSDALNVQPPAATRMVQKLSEMGLVKYEKYGILELEELGLQLGASLLTRHNTVERFLRVIGVGEGDLLEETEKIEHTISKETLRCFSVFSDFIERNPAFQSKYTHFRTLPNKPRRKSAFFMLRMA